MDDMREWEISLLMPLVKDAHRTEWETARYISYNNAMTSGNLKKQYAEKPMDKLFPLPFDKEHEEHDIEISNNQIATLKARSQAVAERLFKKKNKE